MEEFKESCGGNGNRLQRAKDGPLSPLKPFAQPFYPTVEGMGIGCKGQRTALLILCGENRAIMSHMVIGTLIIIHH